MKNLLLIVALVVSQPVWAQSYDTDPNITSGVDIGLCPEFFPVAIDVNRGGVLTLCRVNYAVVYDPKCKIPLITFENLVASALDGNTPRSTSFRPDPSLLPADSSNTADYYRSGYDRGHMVPAGDMRENTASMEQTFYLSNIIPQNPKVNRVVWKYLEEYTTDVVIKNGEIPTYVITGVVVGNKTIGDGVCVPDWTYKIVVSRGNPTSFMVSNTTNPLTSQVIYYRTSLTNIMRLSSVRFYFSR